MCFFSGMKRNRDMIIEKKNVNADRKNKWMLE